MTTYSPALIERIVVNARLQVGSGVVSTRTATAMADQLEAAKAEVDLRRAACEHWHRETIKVGDMHNALGRQFIDVEAERGALLAEVERREPVIQAAQNWAIARCPDAGSCGDGYTYHSNRCPTETTQAALMKAVDAYRTTSKE